MFSYATMATIKACIVVGRFLVFVSLIIQSLFLASYPARNEDKLGWYALGILFVPAAGFWWWIDTNSNAGQGHVGYFWMIYMWVGFVPVTAIVFGCSLENVTSKGLLDPGTLKMALSITPLLFLFMIHTGIASSGFHLKKVNEWSAKATINLFDGIDLLGVLVDQNSIPRDVMNTLIAFACISFLWWPIALVLDRKACDSNYDFQNENKRCLHLTSYVVQVILDATFLGLRSGLSVDYNVNLSLFINKNIFMIAVNSWRVFNTLIPGSNVTHSSEVSVVGTETIPQPTAPPQLTVGNAHLPEAPVLAWVSPNLPPPPYSP